MSPPRDEVPSWGHVAPGTSPRVRTTPTTADLVSYWEGRYRLLRVAEVAEMLGVGPWRIYQVCETGELPHVRNNNSIRVRPHDLQAFIASRLIVPVHRRPPRRKQSGVKRGVGVAQDHREWVVPRAVTREAQ